VRKLGKICMSHAFSRARRPCCSHSLQILLLPCTSFEIVGYACVLVSLSHAALLEQVARLI
jgi:hypothetical protein